MALSSALGAATTGLSASARRIETVANNVANATAEGYARREVRLQANTAAPGVEVVALTRSVDPFRIADRRSADADGAATGLLADHLLRIEQAFGTAEEGQSLQATLDAFDAALVTAAAEPESQSRLAAVVNAAADVAARFSALSATIQQARGEADARIGTEVDRLNADLQAVSRLDRQIAAALATGRDAASLQDRRQQLVDRIATIIPLREYPRPNGQTALVAVNGALLLDGSPATFGFTPAPFVSASSTAPLSGLTMNGRPLATGPDSLIGGGSLSAAFQLRDTVTPALQADLDRLALSLSERLAAADPTLSPTAPGLFTDAGSRADVANLAGLSARLSVNPRVDPTAGGNPTALRDGLAAATLRETGDGTILAALSAALSATTPRSLSGETAELIDRLSTARLAAEAAASTASARQSALTEAASSDSVNTDQELQDLLQIEQAYAANARVIATVDDMLRLLMEV
ncbi:flagellar hook-associated protein FlgK [Tabrizicola sp. TH137]|uniref:flagellar hook-associated protein FlgK n=1 Tax=Tabrizicola sp. TH137 TaxID=2067452 RepID=UPI000C7DD615|nr:flagellar hook-associated protein FlgK [Tabrizicola sp. TH137]PLL14603.1 flagellar hook-associated protein FlgK [Tabrizicola sp. TH137]